VKKAISRNPIIHHGTLINDPNFGVPPDTLPFFKILSSFLIVERTGAEAWTTLICKTALSAKGADCLHVTTADD
jgi:hypothetical protein